MKANNTITITYLTEDAVKQTKTLNNIAHFAYDDCHKIYLLTEDKHYEEAQVLGYKIRSIAELERTYKHSCPLRFIHTWTLDTVVPQCCIYLKVEITDNN